MTFCRCSRVIILLFSIQLDDVISENRDCKLMTSSLRMRCDERTAENERLASENRRLTDKVGGMLKKTYRFKPVVEWISISPFSGVFAG